MAHAAMFKSVSEKQHRFDLVSLHKYENTYSGQLPALLSITLIVFVLHSSNLKPLAIC